MTKILIVDDSATVRAAEHQILTGAGFEVVSATNGLEALRCIRDEEPDLALLDVQMPMMDGIECCSEIKNRHKNVKVIMVTSGRDRKTVSAAFAAGCDGYVTKPIDSEELLAKIDLLVVLSGAKDCLKNLVD